MTATRRVGEYLIRHSGQRFCDDCLTVALALRNEAQASRATQALGKVPGYCREDADCARCGNTKQTIRALWAGI